MHHIEGFRSPTVSRFISHAMLAAVLAAPLLLVPATANAQAKPLTAQQETMVQCLLPCNKGDATCQNGCIQNSPSPAYSTCVKTCANATAAPGQQQSQASDLKICVQACN